MEFYLLSPPTDLYGLLFSKYFPFKTVVIKYKRFAKLHDNGVIFRWFYDYFNIFYIIKKI